MNVTFRVDADNWMAALKTGLAKLGEQGLAANNVLVDVQEDNSLHVTEVVSGRVFRIRELSDQEAAQAELKRARVSPATVPRPHTRTPQERESAKTLISGPPPGMGVVLSPPLAAAPVALPSDPASTAKTMIGTSLTDAVQLEPKATRAPELPAALPGPAAVRAQELSVPTEAPSTPALLSGLGARNSASPYRAEDIGPTFVPMVPTRPAGGDRHTPVPQSRGKAQNVISGIFELEKPVQPVKGQIGRARSAGKSAKEQLEDVLAEVFERVRDVHKSKTPEQGLYFLLDLALEKIPAESGTAYSADFGSGDLSFAAVRGPKAEQLLKSKLTVPAGTGIVGFCSQEGVSLALSDVEKDPRFYSAISEKVNYETRSMLCSPVMTHGRTFGAFQLINRKGGSTFSEHELGLLAYIAHQGALFLNNLA